MTATTWKEEEKQFCFFDLLVQNIYLSLNMQWEIVIVFNCKIYVVECLIYESEGCEVTWSKTKDSDFEPDPSKPLVVYLSK